MKWPIYGVVDLPNLVCQVWPVRVWINICEIIDLYVGRSTTPGLPSMSCQGYESISVKWPFYGGWVDLPHLVCQVWAVRVWINICEIAILWGLGRSTTPGLPSMSCQEYEWNSVKLPFILWGVDLPHLVCQVWAVRVWIKICEMTNLWGGRSAKPGLPSMTCQSMNYNLWNHRSICG